MYFALYIRVRNRRFGRPNHGFHQRLVRDLRVQKVGRTSWLTNMYEPVCASYFKFREYNDIVDVCPKII